MLLDRPVRFILFCMAAFLAGTAIYGGVAVVPSMPLELLAGSPFSDYSLPALILACVGGCALLAAVLLVLKPIWGILLAAAVGLAIMMFEVVETSVVGWDVWLHALGLSPTLGKGIPGFNPASVPLVLGIPLPLWLQPSYFVYGAVMLALSVRMWSRRSQAERGSGAPARAWRPVLERAVIHPITALLVFGGLSCLFALVLHPWFMNWGSSPQERSMPLPGDTAAPDTYFTRAITIDAPPSDVWPWLLAIGQDRAGFLSNDYLENLTGADIHNADVLRPDWEKRAVGDRVPMASPGMRALGGDVTSTTIRILEPERVIADTPGRFVLLPDSDSSTRLLLRETLDDPIRAGAAWVLWDPMHFVMEQRMLRGIKERAERQPLVPAVLQSGADVGWTLAGLSLLGIFLSRRAWRLWVLLPAVLVAPSLLLTGDARSVLAGFLAAGVTVAGCLVFGWRWWPPYLLVSSGVALVLLLAPDSYTTFGLIFLGLVAGVIVRRREQLAGFLHARPEQRRPARATSSW